jgi:hypothetical protein
VDKVELNISDISDDLLAPGNIYWKQKSGKEILISAKADFLNFEMLEKLSHSEKVLLIEDSIECELNNKIVKIFKEYESEISVKEKLRLRKDINLLLMENFYQSEKTQFEFDQLCWKLFSEISREDGKKFLDLDKDFFKRSMSMASSYVICAFLIGYYDERFLRNIYNNTIVNIMNIGSGQVVTELKEKLEAIREKANITDEDKLFIESVIDKKILEQGILFEKFDGSGLMKINLHEMSDLELILSSLNCYFHFNNLEYKNILGAIHDESFSINKKVQDLIKRNFDLLKIDQLAAA